MSEQKLPKGWTPEKVREVAEHYDSQGEDDAVAEDEKALEVSSEMIKTYLLHFAQTDRGSNFALAARAIDKLPDADLLILYEEVLDLQKRSKAG